MAMIDGMQDRTITINAMSKTYSVTGWRVGYVIASADLTRGIRKVHDFLTWAPRLRWQEAGQGRWHCPTRTTRILQPYTGADGTFS